MKKIISTTLVLMVLPMISHGAGYVLANYGDGGKVNGQAMGSNWAGYSFHPIIPTAGLSASGSAQA